MDQFVVCRIGKLGSWGEVGAASSHNNRSRPCPNADAARTAENRVLIGTGSPIDDCRAVHETQLNTKTRSNAVLAVEMILTASPDWFAQHQVEEFTEAALAALRDRYGEDRLANVTLHMDEETPHLHALIVPLDRKPDGRVSLNARGMFGGRKNLKELQDWAGQWGAPLGLKRGKAQEPDSDEPPRRHKTPKDYRADLKEALAAAAQQQQQAAQILSDARIDAAVIRAEADADAQEVRQKAQEALKAAEVVKAGAEAEAASVARKSAQVGREKAKLDETVGKLRAWASDTEAEFKRREQALQSERNTLAKEIIRHRTAADEYRKRADGLSLFAHDVKRWASDVLERVSSSFGADVLHGASDILARLGDEAAHLRKVDPQPEQPPGGGFRGVRGRRLR